MAKNLNTKIPVAYEPKRKNRWILKFLENTSIESWFLSGTVRPSVEVKHISIFGFNFSLKPKWQPMEIKMRDVIGPSSAQAVWKLFSSKNKFNLVLEMLDPTGVGVEKWEINDCKIISLDFGCLSYDSDDLAEIIMVIQPKSVKLLY